MTKSNSVKKNPPSESEIKRTIAEVGRSCLEEGLGGPFGAFVFDCMGKVVGRGVNRVIADNDPTAHAEITAIRDACRNLKTRDLSGYSIYSTGRPCPMCLSAIIWANIKNVWYSADFDEAAKIGFRDDFIYSYIKGGCTDVNILVLQRVPEPEMQRIYTAYAATGKIY